MELPDIDKSRYAIYCRGLDIQQIAFPVGENNDAYYIISSFDLNVLTNEVIVRCTVCKNFYANPPKREENLFVGTFKQCYEWIQSTVYSL